MGVYVVRTSSLNDKHSCQLFRMGLRDKTTPTTLTAPLIRSNMSCAGSYHFSSLAFLSSFISTANLSRLVAASFSSLALLSSSVIMANLSCLLATTFSSLKPSSQYIARNASRPEVITFSTGFDASRRKARRCFFIFVSYPQPFFPLSSFAEALFALNFPFLSERFFFVHAKVALVRSRNQ